MVNVVKKGQQGLVNVVIRAARFGKCCKQGGKVWYVVKRAARFGKCCKKSSKIW